MSRLRVAVIGLGLIGKQRAAALEGIEEAELVATVDPALDRRAAGVPHFSEVGGLPPETFDAAVIAVPHDLARNVAAVILAQGKPVLLEKPLGRSSAEAAELQHLADAVPIPSFVGYNYRFLPSLRGLAAAHSDGTLGALRSVDMLIGHGGNPRSAEGWKLDPTRSGGGVILDPGVHLLDFLLQLMPDAASPFAVATRGFWPTGIEEDAALAFRHENMLATIRVSHIRWINTFRVEVFGDDGYAIAEGRGGNYGSITLRRGRRWAWAQAAEATQRETEEVVDFGSTDTSLADELRAVVRLWRGGEGPGGIGPATFAEARRVAELCDVLYSLID